MCRLAVRRVLYHNRAEIGKRGRAVAYAGSDAGAGVGVSTGGSGKERGVANLDGWEDAVGAASVGGMGVGAVFRRKAGETGRRMSALWVRGSPASPNRLQISPLRSSRGSGREVGRVKSQIRTNRIFGRPAENGGFIRAHAHTRVIYYPLIPI